MIETPPPCKTKSRVSLQTARGIRAVGLQRSWLALTSLLLTEPPVMFNPMSSTTPADICTRRVEPWPSSTTAPCTPSLDDDVAADCQLRAQQIIAGLHQDPAYGAVGECSLKCGSATHASRGATNWRPCAMEPSMGDAGEVTSSPTGSSSKPLSIHFLVCLLEGAGRRPVALKPAMTHGMGNAVVSLWSRCRKDPFRVGSRVRVALYAPPPL